MAKAAVNKEGLVHVLDDAGSPALVDRADLSDALAAGYSLESADSVHRRNIEREYGDIGSQIAAGAEGAVEEATLGLGTAGLVGILGDEYRQQALLRAQENPNARLAGQITGAVAPAFISQGGSLAARGARALTAPGRAVTGLASLAERGVGRGLAGIIGEGRAATVASKAAGTGAAAAIEGAGSGLGSTIARSALEDTDWTAEQALSSMADGAWYGLKTGAPLGAASSVLGQAGKKAVQAMTEGKTFKEALGAIADNRIVQSVLGRNAKYLNELTDFGRDVERARRVQSKIADPAMQSAAAIKAKAAESAKRVASVAKALDGAGVKPNARSVLQGLDEQIVDLRKVGLRSHDKIAKDIARELLPLRAKVATNKPVQFSELVSLRESIDKSAAAASKAKNPASENLRKMRESLDQGLDKAVADHSDLAAKRALVDGLPPPPDLGTPWRQAAEDRKDFSFLNNIVEDAGVGVISALQAEDPGELENVLKGAGTALTYKFVRERGAGWLAKAADKIARNEDVLASAAKRLAGGPSLARVAARGLGDRERNKEFADVQKHVEQFQRDPEYAADQISRVIAPVGKEQPEVATKMAERYQADMAYLASKAPKGFSAGAKSFQPLKETRSYSRDEQIKLTKIATALANPAQAVEDIAEGRIDLDVIEALRVRRPIVFEGLRDKVMAECAAAKDKLPFARRNYLSMVFNFTGDPSLDPSTMAEIQASAPPPPETPAPKGGSLNAAAQAEAMQLPSQKAGI